MERITQRNSMGQAVFKRTISCDRCGEEAWDVYPDFDGITVAEKLCQYEEAEAEGRIFDSAEMIKLAVMSIKLKKYEDADMEKINAMLT